MPATFISRSHPVFAHQVTFLSKFRRNAGSSIGPTTLLVDPVDCFQKTSIRFISSRRSAIDPRVVATGGDTQQTAHGGDWIVGTDSLFTNLKTSWKSDRSSRANQAAAFANISRSTLQLPIFFAQLPAATASFYRRQAVSTTAFIQVRKMSTTLRHFFE